VKRLQSRLQQNSSTTRSLAGVDPSLLMRPTGVGGQNTSRPDSISVEQLKQHYNDEVAIFSCKEEG